MKRDADMAFGSADVDMTSPEERHDEATAMKSFLWELTAASFAGDDRDEFLDELKEDIGEDLEGLLGIGFEEDDTDEMEDVLASLGSPKSEDMAMTVSAEDEDEEMTGTEHISCPAMVTMVFLREHSMDFVEEEGLEHEMRGVDIESGSRVDDLVAVGQPVPKARACL